jgi:hypothetical protein
MDAHEIQNLSALVEVTKGADYSTGKLFDEAGCDGKAAALLAGASEKCGPSPRSAVACRFAGIRLGAADGLAARCSCALHVTGFIAL